jgi:hypothetical protein
MATSPMSPLRQQVALTGADPSASLALLATAVSMDRTDAISQLLAHQGAILGSEPLLPGVAYAEPGDSALHLACRLGKVDAVRALLRAGVVCSTRNSNNQLALEAAQQCEKRLQVENAFVAELLQHVCSGNAARMERLLKGGVKADSLDGSPNQATLLHWAATFGQGREIVRLLCEAGANVNAQNKAGMTPAHEAAGHGSLETLEALVEFGASLQVKDNQGRTPRDVAKGVVAVYFAEEGKAAAPSPPASASMDSPTPRMTRGEDEYVKLRRQHEEQTSLNDSLKGTIDSLLRANGVADHVTRLQDHVGALTRQLTATTEQRDKLQNLYINSERELERALREMAAFKQQHNGGVGANNAAGASSPIANNNGKSLPHHSSSKTDLTKAELEEHVARLAEALEKERKEGYAAARMHLTYEADLRAEIKALQEQLLDSVGDAAASRARGGGGGGLLSSIIPW